MEQLTLKKSLSYKKGTKVMKVAVEGTWRKKITQRTGELLQKDFN